MLRAATTEEEEEYDSSKTMSGVRRSHRVRQAPRKLTYTDRQTITEIVAPATEGTSESSDDEGESMRLPIIDLPRMERDGVGLLESVPISGSILYEAIGGRGGTALQLVVEEWMQGWERQPELASLQLLNGVLWVGGVRRELDLDDLGDSDPAEVLAHLQEELSPEESGNISLPLRNSHPMHVRARPRSQNNASSAQAAFAEFWQRWANEALVAEGMTRQVSRLMLTWLLPMSSAGYRPLRHAAALAAFGILHGCCQKCAKLARELDQAARLAAAPAVPAGAAPVEALAARLASLEHFIQQLFDGVFVSRFRDVDPMIRSEAVLALARWISAYPEVFLDNSYLRYLGWALSDRIASNRISALAALASLYTTSSLRAGMSSFTDRFRARLLEMAERDVEATVRNEACRLVAILLRSGLIDKETLTFINDIVRYRQAIPSPIAHLLQLIICEGNGYEQFLRKLVALLERASSSMSFSQNADDWAEFSILSRIMLFLQKALQSLPSHQHLLATEHFVYTMRKILPVLGNFALMVRFFGFFHQVDNITLLSQSGGEALRINLPLEELDEYTLACLLEAVGRCNALYAGKKPDWADRSTEEASSTELAQHCRSFITLWAADRGSPRVPQDRLLAPYLDLLALCNVDCILEEGAPSTLAAVGWREECLSAIAQLVRKCDTPESTAAAARLLPKWMVKEEHRTLLSPSISSLLQEDLAKLQRISRSSFNSIDWQALWADCSWGRLENYVRFWNDKGMADWSFLRVLFNRASRFLNQQERPSTRASRMEREDDDEKEDLSLPLCIANQVIPSILNLLLFDFEERCLQGVPCTEERDALIGAICLVDHFDQRTTPGRIILANHLLKMLVSLGTLQKRLAQREGAPIPLASLAAATPLEGAICDAAIRFVDTCMQRRLLSSSGTPKEDRAYRQIGLQAMNNLAAALQLSIFPLGMASSLLKWYKLVESPSSERFFRQLYNLISLSTAFLESVQDALQKGIEQYADCLQEQVSTDTFLSSAMAIVNLAVATLKRQQQSSRNMELLLCIQRTILESLLNKLTDPQLINAYLDTVLVLLIPFIGANLAVELSSFAQKQIAGHSGIKATLYFKALERQGAKTARQYPQAARKTSNAQSKLRRELVISYDSAAENDRDGEGIAAETDPFSGSSSTIGRDGGQEMIEPSTPTREMQKLAMNSSDAIPSTDETMASEGTIPLSSPIRTLRKRTIRH